MTDEEYFRMQREFGGRYVARRDAEVIASAKSPGDLIDRTETMTIDWTDVVIA